MSDAEEGFGAGCVADNRRVNMEQEEVVVES